MLKISLIVIGEKMPPWVTQGYQQYAKRIRRMRGVQLTLIEIPAIKRGRNADIHRIMRLEEQKIRNALPQEARIIALDRGGTGVPLLFYTGRSAVSSLTQLDYWDRTKTPQAESAYNQEQFDVVLM